VLRVPAYSPYAIAEHTVGLMLTLNRKLHRAYNRVLEQNFALDGLMGFDMHGKTVGVVGTGRIGEHVFERRTLRRMRTDQKERLSQHRLTGDQRAVVFIHPRARPCVRKIIRRQVCDERAGIQQQPFSRHPIPPNARDLKRDRATQSPISEYTV